MDGLLTARCPPALPCPPAFEKRPHATSQHTARHPATPPDFHMLKSGPSSPDSVMGLDRADDHQIAAGFARSMRIGREKKRSAPPSPPLLCASVPGTCTRPAPLSPAFLQSLTSIPPAGHPGRLNVDHSWILEQIAITDRQGLPEDWLADVLELLEDDRKGENLRARPEHEPTVLPGLLPHGRRLPS